MIVVTIKDHQGKEYAQSFTDDLQAQAFAIQAKENGCEVRISGGKK